MDLKEKHLSDLSRTKEGRKREVLKAALKIFERDGIDAARLTDIADEARIGIASVYRYFKTKTDLVIAAAEILWSEDINSYYSEYLKSVALPLKGIEQIEYFLGLFLDLFDNHHGFLKFIEDFDNFIIQNKIPAGSLENYESIASVSAETLRNAVEKGVADGTIRDETNIPVFIHAASMTLLGLCQKYVSRGEIVPSDSKVRGREEISLMIKILTHYLRV